MLAMNRSRYQPALVPCHYLSWNRKEVFILSIHHKLSLHVYCIGVIEQHNGMISLLNPVQLSMLRFYLSDHPICILQFYFYFEQLGASVVQFT
jgi:hypothetical protein